MKIIPQQRTIIPACDTSFAIFKRLVEETCDHPRVGAYKVGAMLAMEVGLHQVAETVKQLSAKPVIYDHQKAGTDIPDMAEPFMNVLREAKVDAVILFPLAGSQTQAQWTAAARAADLGVIVGGHMTHPGFLASQGGYISDDSVRTIYEHAAGDSVTDYVVPGNKPEVIASIRKLLVDMGVDPIFYAPGFIAQSGEISAADREAGGQWHAIVGRALLEDVETAGGIRSAVDRIVRNF